jgi:acylphosphatase
MESDRIVRLIVTGQVQGVGFRAFVAGMARARGIGGWVRNRRDGAVEAVLAGNADAVAAMISDIQAGPAAGDVDRVETMAETPAPDERVRLFRGFVILPVQGGDKAGHWSVGDVLMRAE